MKKVAIVEFPQTKNRDITVELDIFKKAGLDAQLVVFDEENPDEFYASIKDVDAVLTGYVGFDKKAIDAMDHCEVISVQATGWNFIDDAYAAEKGIKVCPIGEYCTQEVADHTLTLILGLNKYIKHLTRRIDEEHAWEFESLTQFGIRRIEGQTLGIFGLGKIGKAVAKRAQAFGMNIIAYDPYIPIEVAQKIDVKMVSIDELLESSDVITIHMNLTEENTAFFTLDKFKKMKKKPFVINVARGSVICEDSLVEALDTGLIRGAGLDVLASETPDLESCKLLNRDNVIITPHSAFYSEDSMEACSRIAAENIVYSLKGEHNKVNKYVNYKVEHLAID